MYSPAIVSPSSLFDLSGKVAVVIGGTGELCGAMAEGLAAAGAEVVLVGRSVNKADARLARIAAAGGRAWFHATEITDRNQLNSLLAKVLARSGRVDVVINGAGINSATPFLEVSDEEFDRLIAVNLKAVALSCQVFGGHMVKTRQGGALINVGSIAGQVPLSRVFIYSATKAALHNLSKNLAREWASHGVRVNTLVPGFYLIKIGSKLGGLDLVCTIAAVERVGGLGYASRKGLRHLL